MGGLWGPYRPPPIRTQRGAYGGPPISPPHLNIVTVQKCTSKSGPTYYGPTCIPMNLGSPRLNLPEGSPDNIIIPKVPPIGNIHAAHCPQTYLGTHRNNAWRAEHFEEIILGAPRADGQLQNGLLNGVWHFIVWQGGQGTGQ